MKNSLKLILHASPMIHNIIFQLSLLKLMFTNPADVWISPKVYWTATDQPEAERPRATFFPMGSLQDSFGLILGHQIHPIVFQLTVWTNQFIFKNRKHQGFHEVLHLNLQTYFCWLRTVGPVVTVRRPGLHSRARDPAEAHRELLVQVLKLSWLGRLQKWQPMYWRCHFWGMI